MSIELRDEWVEAVVTDLVLLEESDASAQKLVGDARALLSRLLPLIERDVIQPLRSEVEKYGAHVATETAKAIHRVAEVGRRTSAPTTKHPSIPNPFELCDICGGTGSPTSGKPCACGGTGRMWDALRYIRQELFNADGQLEAAEAERDEAIATIRKLRRVLELADRLPPNSPTLADAVRRIRVETERALTESERWEAQ